MAPIPFLAFRILGVLGSRVVSTPYASKQNRDLRLARHTVTVFDIRQALRLRTP